MTETTDTRKQVCDALLRVNTEGGYSNLVLNALLSGGAVDKRDHAFVSALFYGTLERRLSLDCVIDAYTQIPPKKISREVREILRISLYQLLYMQGVPDYSAVNEGVGLAKRYRQTSAAPFVNGVLRAVQKNRDNLFPKGFATREMYLSYQYSCPEWLVHLFMESYGPKRAKELLAHTLGRPALHARANTLRVGPDALAGMLREQGMDAETQKVPEGCISLGQTGHIPLNESFQSGLFHIQDRSSQLCCLALGAQPGETVLDMCAAPGGKSFTCAQYMRNQGRVIAVDVHEHKLGLIAEGAKRLGLSIVEPRLGDARHFDPGIPQADRVLCDVPCSGFGVIRRKPEIKYKQPQDVEKLYPLQAQILETAARYVKPGGVLLYSTCTCNPFENERQVERFLNGHKDFQSLPLCDIIGEYEQESQPGTLALLPGEENDGFFLHTMKRMW